MCCIKTSKSKSIWFEYLHSFHLKFLREWSMWRWLRYICALPFCNEHLIRSPVVDRLGHLLFQSEPVSLGTSLPALRRWTERYDSLLTLNKFSSSKINVLFHSDCAFILLILVFNLAIVLKHIYLKNGIKWAV